MRHSDTTQCTYQEHNAIVLITILSDYIILQITSYILPRIHTYDVAYQTAPKTGIIAVILLVTVILTTQQQSIQASDDNDGANPYCDKVADNYQGTCHDRYDVDEETGKATCNDGTHKDDPQDCKDATNNRGGAGTREDDGEFVN